MVKYRLVSEWSILDHLIAPQLALGGSFFSCRRALKARTRTVYNKKQAYVHNYLLQSTCRRCDCAALGALSQAAVRFPMRILSRKEHHLTCIYGDMIKFRPDEEPAAARWSALCTGCTLLAILAWTITYNKNHRFRACGVFARMFGRVRRTQRSVAISSLVVGD